MQFINFMLQPKVIEGVTNTVRYPNAVPASKPMVDAAARDDPSVYPGETALGRSFTVTAVAEPAVRARTRMWARFKAGH